jgi:hypothetical protein
MKAIRIAVVAGVLVGLVAATVHGGLISAHISGKRTELKSGVVTTKTFSDKDLISLVTTSKTAKLVIDDSDGDFDVVDKCGNLISNVTTQVGVILDLGPDANSNEVEAVVLSFQGTGDTNGTAVVTISTSHKFKATSNFQLVIGGDIFTGKITTSSAFKAPSSCP